MTNVLLFNLDDVPYEDLAFMPYARRYIQARGTTFTGARHNTPLCHPSRAGFWTGQLSKHHGVLNVGLQGFVPGPEPNWNLCWPAAVAQRGVRIGEIGKFTNFAFYTANYPAAPVGFDTFLWVQGGNQKAGTYPVHGSEFAPFYPAVRQGDFFTQQAQNFVRGAGPWVLVVDFNDPHGPWNAEPEDTMKNPPEDWWPRTEADVTDKPSWIQSMTALTQAEQFEIRQGFRRNWRELMRTDRAIRDVMETVRATGQLDDTIVVLTADNGVYRGEHRRPNGKSGPYDVALRVPMLARGPGFDAGVTVTAPVYPTHDVTAMIMDLYGATPLLDHQAGLPLTRIAADPAGYAGRVLLHEVGGPDVSPDAAWVVSMDGITTGPDHPQHPDRKLFRSPAYRVDTNGPYTRECYDLDDDPDEWANWAENGARASERSALEAILEGLLA